VAIGLLEALLVRAVELSAGPADDGPVLRVYAALERVVVWLDPVGPEWAGGFSAAWFWAQILCIAAFLTGVCAARWLGSGWVKDVGHQAARASWLRSAPAATIGLLLILATFDSGLVTVAGFTASLTGHCAYCVLPLWVGLLWPCAWSAVRPQNDGVELAR